MERHTHSVTRISPSNRVNNNSEEIGAQATRRGEERLNSTGARSFESPIPPPSTSATDASPTMSSMRQRSGFHHSGSNASDAGRDNDNAREADIAAGSMSSSSRSLPPAPPPPGVPQNGSVSNNAFRPSILKRTGYASVVHTDNRVVNEFEEFAESFSHEYDRQRGGSHDNDALQSLPSRSRSDSSGNDEGPPLPQNRLTVLGVDVSHLPKSSQFILCSGGVFGFSLIYGFLQELLSVQILGRQLGLFLALSQFVGYTIWSFIFRTYVEHKHGLGRIGNQPALIVEGYYNRKGIVTSAITPSSSCQSLTDLASEAESESHIPATLKGHSARTPSGQTEIPTNMYVGLSLLRAIDLGMTNLAMQYVNYPAKTLMKSSRVVFTMMFGILFLRRKYKRIDFVVVGLMVTGLGAFLHADASSSAVFQPIGIFMLATSLMCDGAITNMSESLMQKHNVGQDEFIFRLYSIATIAIFAAATYKGDLTEGIQFMMVPGTYDEVNAGTNLESQYTVWKKFLIMSAFSTTGFLGSSCAAAITKEFGALTMSITSTARKATTLFISFMIFPNECSTEHVVGIVIFISSLVVKTAGKGVNKMRRHQSSRSKRRRSKQKQKFKSSAPNSVNSEIGHLIV